MEDVIADISNWLAAGDETFALATVVATWGSAPRQVGAKMAISAGGEISGSVSGGCVEGAVIEAAAEVLADGRPQLLHFGVADATAWSVGLACGGEIEVFIERLDHRQGAWLAGQLTGDQEGRIATVIRGPEGQPGRKVGAFAAGSRLQTLDDSFAEQALVLARARTTPGRVALAEDIELFIDVFLPAPALVVVGGVHIAMALLALAPVLGFQTVVIDPRRVFGSEARFAHAGRLIQAWPAAAFEEVSLTANTAVVLLTHDPKIDDAALKVVLGSPVYYIGALGSRRTHAQRVARLHSYGFSQEQVARIHAPVGLDIGAKEPAEIALAILAEIVKTRRGNEGAGT